jgi:cytochrome c oxidase assembly protein subunit 11
MNNAAHDRTPKAAARRRDLIVAAACGVFVAVMVGAAYAAVPLYSWFCRTTGFGGTTQVASAAPGEVLGRKMTVRFDANVGTGLPWKFQKINCFCFTEQRMKAGETREMPVVFYVDPALAKDAEQNGLNTITLSYTFYPVREREQPVADARLKTAHDDFSEWRK